GFPRVPDLADVSPADSGSGRTPVSARPRLRRTRRLLHAVSRLDAGVAPQQPAHAGSLAQRLAQQHRPGPGGPALPRGERLRARRLDQRACASLTIRTLALAPMRVAPAATIA